MTERIEVPADVLKRFEAVRQVYQTKPKKANTLLYGPPGSGKSYSLRTAVRPLHVDSFDPGGTRTLSDIADKPGVILDTRWEEEDDYSPKVFAAWEREMEERKRIKYFDYIGTFVLDSFTLWTEAALNEVKGSKKGGATLPEYNLRLIRVRKALKDILALPCNVVITSHPFYEKDMIIGKTTCKPFDGKMGVRLPPMFDEIYYAIADQTPKGIEYKWAMRPQGVEPARSRLIKGGDASLIYIEPDLKAALRRAGFPAEDLNIG